ncbi:MAG: MucB/RseB C-terminal domain-containing protein [Stagnimonas sp.]|nr:MucB/RseB C-terminal domain-containing protein [Stagnimonas sp.]
MLRRRLAACVLGLAAAGVVHADPEQLLLRAADAARTANYRGVVIYRAGGAIESLRLVHGYADGIERERLTALTGEPREIIRQDNKIICLLPRERRLDMKRPALKGLLTQVSPETLRELAAWYELRELGGARVAGRQCRGVELAPRDDYRYGFEIWSDEASGVPLKVRLVSRDHRVLEEVMFTEVDFPDSLPLQAFEPALDARQFRSVTRQEPTLSNNADLSDFPLSIGSLPAGFRVTLRERRPARDGRGMVEHVLISDGLSAVSIFAAQNVPPEKAFNGLSNMGAVHAYGRSFGGFHVTVVGETPSAAVRYIGENLTAKDAPAPPP